MTRDGDEPARIFTPEYYERLAAAEEGHWWSLGMTDLMAMVLGSVIAAGSVSRVLDVGCGAGVGLRWAERILPAAHRVGCRF